jgi:hypothetical protein
VKEKFYLGSNFIKKCGYEGILKFHFYDQITNTQIYKLYSAVWKLKQEYNIQKFKSIYMPFYTDELNHYIKKENYLFYK